MHRKAIIFETRTPRYHGRKSPAEKKGVEGKVITESAMKQKTAL